MRNRNILNSVRDNGPFNLIEFDIYKQHLHPKVANKSYNRFCAFCMDTIDTTLNQVVNTQEDYFSGRLRAYGQG